MTSRCPIAPIPSYPRTPTHTFEIERFSIEILRYFLAVSCAPSSLYLDPWNFQPVIFAQAGCAGIFECRGKYWKSVNLANSEQKKMERHKYVMLAPRIVRIEELHQMLKDWWFPFWIQIFPFKKSKYGNCLKSTHSPAVLLKLDRRNKHFSVL